jgi:hypothetical protein
MALVAFTSAKGSPGASTAALAFALAWKTNVVLAECDPAGGDLLAGYLGRLSIPADRGLLQVALADARSGSLAQSLWGQLIDVDPPPKGRGTRRLVLPGLAGPHQAPSMRATWTRLARTFQELEAAQDAQSGGGFDVIADCGRLSSGQTPWPIFHAADLVLVVVRPTSLRSVAPVWPALGEIRRELIQADAADHESIGLLTIGAGDYPRSELEQRLQVPVVAQLPFDERTAAALCGRGALGGSRDLLRHAASAEASIREAVAAHRARRFALSEQPAGGGYV